MEKAIDDLRKSKWLKAVKKAVVSQAEGIVLTKILKMARLASA